MSDVKQLGEEPQLLLPSISHREPLDAPVFRTPHVLHPEDSESHGDTEPHWDSTTEKIHELPLGNVDPLDSDTSAAECRSDEAEKSDSSPGETPIRADESPGEKTAPADNLGLTFSFKRDGYALAKRLARVHLTIIVAYFGLMSVYWGALYHREHRVGNMNMLVAIEDDGVVLANGTRAEGFFSGALNQLFAQELALGKFERANMTELAARASRTNSSMFDMVCLDVHQQKYWAVFYVNATASQTVYDFLVQNVTANASLAAAPLYLVLAIYESGRHYSALSQYVTKNMRKLGARWLQDFAGAQYAHVVRYLLTAAQRTAYLQRVAAGAALALPAFNLVDLRPAVLAAVLGPSELGLVYAMIFSFHQFNFSADLHNAISEQLRFRHYLWYRVLFSQFNHLMLSLVYALMTLAFQVPVGQAYGRSGFAVLWFTMFMYISALGGLNEIAVTCIKTWATKALMPPWIIFTIVSNISPAFAPLILSPGFYRYGYAMPMFNAYEALRVVFFDTYRGTLGRNYAVLGAWIVATNIVLCYVLKLVNDRNKRHAKAKREEAEEAGRASRTK